MMTRRSITFRRGMTLTEVLVATFLLSIFGLAAAASLTLAMRQWRQVGTKVNAIQNARYLASVISTELRTGVPCNNSTIGWQSLSPSPNPLAPTAVHIPNTNNTTATNMLVFMRPNPAGSPPLWNPLEGNATGTTWANTEAQSYARVCYNTTGLTSKPTVANATYPVGNTTITRNVCTYNSGGAIATNNTDVIATCENVLINYRATAPNYTVVNVVCQEGRYVATYATVCQITGR